MDSITIAYVQHVGSDWIALYKGGKKVYEGHPPEPAELLGILGIEATETVVHPADLIDDSRMRGMPDTLDA